MVWLNEMHHNFPAAPGSFGGSKCTCPECNKPLEDSMNKNDETLMDELHSIADECHTRNFGKGSALKSQVGGFHYKEYQIQPYEFFLRNKIPHHKAAIIRRILRYDHPTGKGLQDLDKISHEIELIKELEGWNNATYEED